MIWHFFEVWVLMLAAFALGCPIGALAYKLIADSRLAGLQGNVADAVGDAVDGIKSRLGIGPVWRPEYRRLIERSAHDDGGEPAIRTDPQLEGPRGQERLPPAPAIPMIAARPGLHSAPEDQADEFLSTALLPVAGDVVSNNDLPMARPMALAAPRKGVPDDLQRIRGIGKRIEQRLNALGIYHFGQIAAWTPAEIRWVSHQLAFPDRIERDDWVGQAIVLAAGGSTGFLKSADRRRARRWNETFATRPEDESAEAEETTVFDVPYAAGDDDKDIAPGEETLGDTLQAALNEIPTGEAGRVQEGAPAVAPTHEPVETDSAAAAPAVSALKIGDDSAGVANTADAPVPEQKVESEDKPDPKQEPA